MRNGEFTFTLRGARSGVVNAFMLFCGSVSKNSICGRRSTFCASGPITVFLSGVVARAGRRSGDPKALDQSKMALAQRMHASDESASTIAQALGVSRATVYRVLAERDDE